MRIVSIREAVVPIMSSIRNAYIDFRSMTASVVAITTDVVVENRPVVGFGFNSNGRYAPQGLLQERFIPRLETAPPDSLLGADGLLDPFKAWDAMMANEKPGGHGERSVAVGVLDMALWDAVSKAAGLPLWKLVADRFRDGQADDSAWIYAAGGYYYPDEDLNHLADELRQYLDLGYDTVKMKIGGVDLASDLRRIDTALEVVGDGRHLAVDANGRFDFATALRYSSAISDYGLRWYEEPLEPLDFLMQAALATCHRGPIATGENLFSMVDARNLIRYGGLRSSQDVLQFDPALSYGLVEYLRTLDMLNAEGWSPRRCIPHGGHQFALNLAIGLGLGGNESYPLVFAPFGRLSDGASIRQGRVACPDAPGIGLETNGELWRILRSSLMPDE